MKARGPRNPRNPRNLGNSGGIEFLPWQEIRPVVELAGYYVAARQTIYNYRNPAHHLILVDGGRVECDTPDGPFVAQKGDLICFRPAERNGYRAHHRAAYYQAVIEFAPPPRHRATPVWDDVGPLPLTVSLGDSLPAMRRLIETICLELPRAGSAHQMRVRAAVYDMLAIITARLRPGGTGVAHGDPWHRARLTLESQLAAELRVDHLARQMGMSVNHFIRQFRGRFGATPKAYHTRLRLREGARLLRDPERSVKSIAYLLGFTDSKTFARRFRHHFGVNPTDLRRDAVDTAGAADAAPPPKDLFFTVNQHVLPPYAGQDYLERYLVRGKQ